MDETQDDDIAIDFTKVANFFKKKKPAKKPKKEAKPKEKPVDIEEVEKATAEKEMAEEEIEENATPEPEETPKEEEKQKEETKKEEPEDEQDDDDEDISVDLTKVKGFFKKMTKDDEETEAPEEKDKKETSSEEQDEDEDISFDFSKVKKFFSKEKRSSKEKTDDDEDVSVDWQSVAAFGKKHAVILLILIPIFLSLFLRLQPVGLPITEEWATQSVQNHFRGQIATQVNAQYPNLPQQNRDVLINNQLATFLEQNEAGIEQQITAVRQQFKDQLSDESGQTYMLAIDPFFWERHSRNVIENGHPGDELKEGIPWDNHMFAPKGRPIPPDFLHAHFQAFLFKVVSVFNGDIKLKNVAFFSSALIATLAILPAFFIGRRLGGNVAGLFAGTLLAVHAQFMTRTVAGFADTDAYTVTLPLFATWAFLEAFEAKELWKRIALVATSSFFIGLFSFAWTGAWYIFDIIIASMGIYLIYQFGKHFKSIKFNVIKFLKLPAVKNTMVLLLAFIILTGLFVTLFRDFNTFSESFVKGPLGFEELKDVATKNIWPNVYTTVAEQNPSSLPGVINAMGGNMLFFLAIVGALLAIFKRDKHGNRDLKIAGLLIIWMVVSTYAAVKGVRFSLLIVPPFAIGFGMFVGITYEYIRKWASKELKINKIATSIVLVLLFSLLLIKPIDAGYNVAVREVPSMNDGWHSALTKIKDASPPDAIINSWWDFGHWFKNIADRAVTFDGTSQNTPQAHWIGKVLLTSDEDEAIGILRMLDCGANDAFDELVEITGDPLTSIYLLKDIIPEHSRVKASASLKKEGLSKEERDAVLELTHCEPPQNYFIASEDMIGKSGVWAHFGSWDFTRASMYKSVNNLNPGEGITILKDLFELAEQDAEEIYFDIQNADPNQWIAPWPSYASGLSGCTESEKTLLCSNGIKIDIKSRGRLEAYVDGPEGKLYPKTFAYPTKDELVINEHEGDDVLKSQDGRELGLTLVPQGNTYATLLMSAELAGSMFTRLFYLEAHGLEHFQLFTQENTITGGKVFVYNVSWEPGEMNLKSELRPKTEVLEGYVTTINYIGYTEDDVVFDSTIKDVTPAELSPDDEFDDYAQLQRFSFSVGGNQVIPGMDQQIRGMKINEEKVMEIPPEQGYGLDPTAHPLGNKTLFFKVRVEAIA